MLSNACKYAIRAVLFLGLNSNENIKFGAEKLAKELEMPKPFLAQLLRSLSLKQLISSTKGPGGGFYTNKLNLKNTIWDVIVLIDRELKFEECFLGLSKCDDKHPCPVHNIVSPFRKKILNDFKNKTIIFFVNKIKKNKTVISLKYLKI
jgi:Rrf2 family transcriptional regulator, iron-sulfur cluster assembly transcription factor